MSIQVTNLSKRYGVQKAVDNISFTIRQGEVVGFLGPNGAGKSTTMKMITGYLEPDTGSVSVAGIKVSVNNTATKKKIGYLPESNPLYLDMYVREYLGFIAGIHGIDNTAGAIQSAIETTGLLPEANKKIGQLSKGYKQRVGLAAALIHDPEVLILDEPTTGLDPNQIVEIRDVIRRLAQKKTILFSSHILQEVQAICDRVIIINKGMIVADDLLSKLQQVNPGETMVLVAFKEKVTPEMLSGIEYVAKIEPIPEMAAGVGAAYQLHTTRLDSVRKQLLEISISSHLNIVSLQSQQVSLEDIFKSLTADTKGQII